MVLNGSCSTGWGRGTKNDARNDMLVPTICTSKTREGPYLIFAHVIIISAGPDSLGLTTPS